MTLPDRLFPPSPPLIRTVLSFVAGVFILMVPVAAWLTLTGTLTIDLYWTVSAFFGVQVLATLLYSLAIARPGGVLAATAILLVLSTGIEFVGVTTGFPFGSYYYSYFLDPFVAGNVPLAIPLLWFVLVVNAFFLSTVGVKDGAGPFRSLLLAGVMVVGMGILLEPFAA
ncbi:MAG: carotenoid biosynthesis protein, partial [Bacteroidota bacterium]